MKKIMCFFMSMILFTVAVSGCKNEVTKNDEAVQSNSIDNSNETVEEIAAEYVRCLVKEQYNKAFSNFNHDEKMNDAIKSNQLKIKYEQLFKGFGKIKTLSKPIKTESGEYTIVAIPSQFKNQNVNINVIFNNKKDICGLNFTQYDSPDDANTENIEVKVPEGITETKMDLNTSKNDSLAGILTTPNIGSNIPCVVLVHGSGPNDMDETIYDNKPFRDIAWGLAKQGVASYRYDKRTKTYQTKYMYDYNFTIEDETVSDSVDAVNMLADVETINKDKIFVLGHSLGGYAIPRIADKTENASGYIIMAGFVRRIDELMREQYAYLVNLDDHITHEEQAQLDSINAELDKLNNLNKLDDKTLILGAYKKYWQDIRAYNPIDMAKKITKPVLVLQGGRDYQVPMTDFNLWKGAFGNKDNWSYEIYKDLNHLMMYGEGKPNPTEYAIENTVNQNVIDDIVSWIKGDDE